MIAGTGVVSITVTYKNGKKDRINIEKDNGRLVVEKRIKDGEELLVVVEKNPGDSNDVLVVPFDSVKGTTGKTKQND